MWEDGGLMAIAPAISGSSRAGVGRRHSGGTFPCETDRNALTAIRKQIPRHGDDIPNAPCIHGAAQQDMRPFDVVRRILPSPAGLVHAAWGTNIHTVARLADPASETWDILIGIGISHDYKDASRALGNSFQANSDPLLGERPRSVTTNTRIVERDRHMVLPFHISRRMKALPVTIVRAPHPGCNMSRATIEAASARWYPMRNRRHNFWSTR